MHAKNNNGKSKKDTRNCFEFQNIPWHKTDKCLSIQSLVVELKYKESNIDLEPDLENNKRRQIIDVEPTATVATTIIQP
jgi:hypothetical protein